MKGLMAVWVYRIKLLGNPRQVFLYARVRFPDFIVTVLNCQIRLAGLFHGHLEKMQAVALFRVRLDEHVVNSEIGERLRRVTVRPFRVGTSHSNGPEVFCPRSIR